jgi:hypothetical protein
MTLLIFVENILLYKRAPPADDRALLVINCYSLTSHLRRRRPVCRRLALATDDLLKLIISIVKCWMYDVLHHSWPMEENKTGSQRNRSIENRKCLRELYVRICSRFDRAWISSEFSLIRFDGWMSGRGILLRLYVHYAEGGRFGGCNCQREPWDCSDSYADNFGWWRLKLRWHCVTFSWLDSAASRRMDG